jgi:hydroxylamine reductase
MFCYQCEQTAKGVACDTSGVCGKQPDVATLQDLLVYALTGLAQVAVTAKKKGIRDRAADVFTCEALLPRSRTWISTRTGLCPRSGGQLPSAMHS